MSDLDTKKPRPAPSSGQPSRGGAAPVSQREQMRYNVLQAIDAHAYLDAAIIMNGFSQEDLDTIVRSLPPQHLGPLRAAAVDGMPSWSDRVVHSVDSAAAAANEVERVRKLNEAFDAAVLMKDWANAAIHLNAFNDGDIVRKLKPLGPDTLEAIAAAAPDWAFRITRIARGMIPEPAHPAAPPSTASGPSYSAPAAGAVGAAGMVVLGKDALGLGQGPLRAPGLAVDPVKAPGFGPNSFRTPFVEPPPTVQIPARAPGLPTAPAIDPLPAGVTAEVRLASALGRILAVGTEVVGAIAVPLTMGAEGWSDTNMEALNRNLRVSIVEGLHKKVLEVNRSMADALRRQDFSLIRDKAPGLFDAALKNATPENLGLAIALLKLAYGIALEKHVADAVLQDEFLKQYLEYVGGPHRADFYGKKGGLMGGLMFDVTTRRDVDRHIDPIKRPRYGEHLIPVPYQPPWAEDAW